MIGISRLYCDVAEASDALRYKRRPETTGPVVVWNCTPDCNLTCQHCYSAQPETHRVMTTEQAAAMMDDLKAMGCPVLLLSGGEPLLRRDLPALLDHAQTIGLRTVLSTNGTLLTPELAGQLAQWNIGYVGVSLDAAEPKKHDAFRGQPGSFADALNGLAMAQQAGLKVGLRFTLHRGNLAEVPALFDLIAERSINRVCFYHLVPTGRGADIADRLPSAAEIRPVIDTILKRTRAAHAAGNPLEVLTVGNHADGAYLYLKLLKENPARAEEVFSLLAHNGGNRSGDRIACVGWDGEVYPDQFWRTRPIGNVLNKPFCQTWTDPHTPLLSELRNRKNHLTCRCTHCKFLPLCNGNLRARAEATGHGLWGEDPACYLSDEEIAP